MSRPGRPGPEVLLAQSLLFRSLPIFLSCSMFVITVAGGGQLTASAVFTTLALADTLRAPLSQLSDLLSELVNAHASLHSVQAFLALQGQVGPGGCSGSGPYWQAAGDRMPCHGASTLETVGIAGGGMEAGPYKHLTLPTILRGYLSGGWLL